MTQVRSFLGFTNYYRRFIKGYAKVAKPVNNLIQGENSKKKNKHKKVEWSSECQEAFEELKTIVHYNSCVGLCRLQEMV